LPLTSIGVNTFVVDPRRAHHDRTGGGEHLTLLMTTVADDQPVTVLIDLVGVGVDVGGHLSLQRCGQHLPGTVADDLIQQRSTATAVVLVGAIRIVNYREQGRTFPNQRANAGS
jgi:hypothetical protein